MRGHVGKRGKTWTVIYDDGTHDDGKRRQRWKGGFATRKEAQAFLTEQLKSIGDGSYVQPSKVTLGAYLDEEWLPAIAGTVRPLTLAQYQSIVRSRIGPRIGHLRLQALSGGHLNGLYRDLEAAGLSAGSRRLTHAVLSRALRDAVRWGKVPRNAAQAADPPALADSRVTAWTAKELGRFLEHVRGDRLYGLWRLAATTGMRRGELLGLTWLALDLEAGTLRVDQQLIPTAGGCTFGPPKSKRSRRTIALDPDTVEALRAHRDAQLLERAYADDAYADGDLVFCDELGGPINPMRLTDAFLRHRKAAGLTVGTLHILRHTHATLALTNGVPLHVAAARLGDRAETMLKSYAHLLPTSDADAAEQVAALIVAPLAGR